MASPFASAGVAWEEAGQGPLRLQLHPSSSTGSKPPRSSPDESSLRVRPGSAPLPDGRLHRTATTDNSFDLVGSMLEDAHGPRPHLPPAGPEPEGPPGGGQGGPRTLTDARGSSVKWIQPSGPRQQGQGVEDVEQGVVVAEASPTGGAILRITLLAAGFVIGPSGSSIRDICKLSGADVKSWTAEADHQCSRPTRVFRAEGSPGSVAHALGVICDAVERYKELCEGKYAGQSVSRIQPVSGVDFSYQPPPRNIVPFAASLKGQSSRRQGNGAASKTGGGCGSKPPAGPSFKEALSRAASNGGSGPHVQPNPSLTRSSSLPQPPREDPAAPPRPASRGPAGSRPNHVPAPTQKLQKGDVLTTVFGTEDTSQLTHPPHCPGADVAALMEQLALQEAQATAAAQLNAAPAPASYTLNGLNTAHMNLPPLAAAAATAYHLPGANGGLAHVAPLPAMGADALAHLAAAVQDAQLQQVLAHKQLLQLAAAGLLGSAYLPATPCTSPTEAHAAAGADAGGGGQEQVLEALQGLMTCRGPLAGAGPFGAGAPPPHPAADGLSPFAAPFFPSGGALQRTLSLPSPEGSAHLSHADSFHTGLSLGRANSFAPFGELGACVDVALEPQPPLCKGSAFQSAYSPANKLGLGRAPSMPTAMGAFGGGEALGSQPRPPASGSDLLEELMGGIRMFVGGAAAPGQVRSPALR